MSDSTGTGPPDQRDLDEQLLSGTRRTSGSPAVRPGPEKGFLQTQLDRATGGAYPRWENNRWLEDSRCVVYTSPSEDRRCHRDATEHVWIGCRSEHIARSGVCSFHAAELATAKFGWRCNLCFEATGEVVLAYFIKREPIGEGQDADLGRQGPDAARELPA
jgi:hypothetical protein